MRQRPFAPLNGGITPITIQQHTHNPAWGGSGTVPAPVLCRDLRQPSQGLAKVMWALYYGLVLGMAACVVGGFANYLTVRHEAQRIAAEQARTYNQSVAEMERILWQMHRQKASADLEERNIQSPPLR